jgi:metal-responsive CopG/Arc/MetJ family transcriptional regulator
MRTTKGFSITVPKELAAQIERAAKGQCRSRSSYLAWLIRKDSQEISDQQRN